MLTQRNDNGRTGANLNEAILTTANVNPTQFGKRFEQAVDGDVYAQPLYVPNVVMSDHTRHNVVYVATMANTVFAFDADDNEGANAEALWKVNLGPSVPAHDLQCVDQEIRSEVGILSTPVIDPGTKTLYVVARTKGRDGSYHQRLHALDITSGSAKFARGVEIKGQYRGGRTGSIRHFIAFDPMRENQRAALLLLNGIVYIAWASHGDGACDKADSKFPYPGPRFHGWIMGYDAKTLAQKSIFNTSPDAQWGGGIWQSGTGLAVDARNNIYASTGNGPFNRDTTTSEGTEGTCTPPDKNRVRSPRNVGDSVLKLNTTNGKLSLLDFFTPSNHCDLSALDLDFGSTGVLVLPGGSYVVAAGKEGKIYLLDGARLGGYRPIDAVADEVQASPSPIASPHPRCVMPSETVNPAGLHVCSWQEFDHIHGSPVYWNAPSSGGTSGISGPTIYVWAERDYLKAFRLFGDHRFGREPVSQSLMKAPVNPAESGQDSPGAAGVRMGMPGGILSISANHSRPGTGIVWATHPYRQNPRRGVDANGHVVRGILRAFDAADLSRELWNSQQEAQRDTLGNFAKFCAPTIANGKVYLATFSGKLVVYGLLPPGYAPGESGPPAPGPKQ